MGKSTQRRVTVKVTAQDMAKIILRIGPESWFASEATLKRLYQKEMDRLNEKKRKSKDDKTFMWLAQKLISGDKIAKGEIAQPGGLTIISTRSISH